MCYAIPAKLIAIEDTIGVVDYFGEHRKILLDLEEVEVGDYVYVQGGVLVRKIPPDIALEILAQWRTIFFTLKQTDLALTESASSKLSSATLAILQKGKQHKPLSRREMLAILALQDTQELSGLYRVANKIRQQEHGNGSCVHGIIEFSNYCRNNCYYCGLRNANRIPRYRMSIAEIIATATIAVKRYGFKALVLQAGEDLWYDTRKLVAIVRAVRALGVLVFVSIGSRSRETYQRLYAAGARAALLRFETANRELFAQLRPGSKLSARIELIKYLQQLGYVLATGFIVGLPGESSTDIVNNILLTKSLVPAMYSFGPLIPTHNTPLATVSKVTKELVLKTIALTRLVASDANILVTTALETLSLSAKREALLAGANSMMLNVTPAKYRALYTIYDNRANLTQTVAAAVTETTELLSALGRAPTDIGI